MPNLDPVLSVLGVLFVAPFALAPLVIFLLIVRRLLGRSRREDPKVTAEEARLMQEIHRGLNRMDQRIESLETLLLGASKTRRAPSEGETT